jgi:hypothetical protein
MFSLEMAARVGLDPAKHPYSVKYDELLPVDTVTYTLVTPPKLTTAQIQELVELDPVTITKYSCIHFSAEKIIEIGGEYDKFPKFTDKFLDEHLDILKKEIFGHMFSYKAFMLRCDESDILKNWNVLGFKKKIPAVNKKGDALFTPDLVLKYTREIGDRTRNHLGGYVYHTWMFGDEYITADIAKYLLSVRKGILLTNIELIMELSLTHEKELREQLSSAVLKVVMDRGKKSARS